MIFGSVMLRSSTQVYFCCILTILLLSITAIYDTTYMVLLINIMRWSP